MKISEVKLTADARQRLESARDELATAFAVRDKAQERAGAVAAKKESLADEVRSARASLDPLDDRAVEHFAGRERQAELVAAEVKKSSVAVANAEAEIVMAARRGASTLRSVLLPVFNTRVEEATDLFQPYFENRAGARSAVMASSWGAAFTGTLGQLLRVEGTLESENILRALDKTLAGSIAWCFWRGAE